jgi:hypothetical protein
MACKVSSAAYYYVASLSAVWYGCVCGTLDGFSDPAVNWQSFKLYLASAAARRTSRTAEASEVFSSAPSIVRSVYNLAAGRKSYS